MIVNDPTPQALSPCPFCGGPGNVIDVPAPQLPGVKGGGTMSLVLCQRCGGHGPVRQTREEAVKGWNTRHDRNTGLTIVGGV